MNSFATRFSSPSSSSFSEIPEGDNGSIEPALWGSAAGFGNLGKVGVPAFDIPAIPNVRASVSHCAVLLGGVATLIVPNSQPNSYNCIPMTTQIPPAA